MAAFTALASERDMRALINARKQGSEGQQRQFDDAVRAKKEKELKSSRSTPSLKKGKTTGNTKGKGRDAGPSQG